MTITCIPKSLCSWDFQVSGISTGLATLTFDFFSEQGSVFIGGTEYSVRKHGLFSGHWSLERGGEIFVDAKKPSAMFRSFELRAGDIQLTLKAHSAFTRSYDIVTDGAVAGTIKPAHAFTRRAFIECNEPVPEIAQLFAFWLVVLTWRQAARNNNASPGMNASV
ncbi:MAG: hypothetical protein JWL59_4198 [Chthoniobacteraceae bacterium]|nr:hypothetical protein [Chthoniobacteraceae bacterium]